MARALVLICISFGASACIPIPHVEQEVPELFGQISRDGKPAYDVKITIATTSSRPASCTGDARASTISDRAGRFHLERQGYWTPFIMMGDPISQSSLCFQFPDGLNARWSVRNAARGNPRWEISCTLTSSSAAIDLGTFPDNELREFVRREHRENRCVVVHTGPSRAPLSDVDWM